LGAVTVREAGSDSWQPVDGVGTDFIPIATLPGWAGANLNALDGNGNLVLA